MNLDEFISVHEKGCENIKIEASELIQVGEFLSEKLKNEATIFRNFDLRGTLEVKSLSSS